MMQSMPQPEILLRDLARAREAHVAESNVLRALRTPTPGRSAGQREDHPHAATWLSRARELFGRRWERPLLSPSSPRHSLGEA